MRLMAYPNDNRPIQRWYGPCRTGLAALHRDSLLVPENSAAADLRRRADPISTRVLLVQLNGEHPSTDDWQVPGEKGF